MRTIVLLLGMYLLAPALATKAEAQERHLERGDVPTNNPLKGLVPYARPVPERFPHSMEFQYLGLARIVQGDQKFDWGPLEKMLDDVASRGNQSVLRFYLEYPGKDDGIPPYLIDKGLKVHKYLNTNTAPFPPTEVVTPDYEDPRLRALLVQFIEALGNKYDGDPRVAYITAGLLGTWGEWHTYPRNDLWASKAVQSEILDAYEASFRETPILLRYPAGSDHYDKAPNADRRLGYHDDSLCWATLDTGREADTWFFESALKAAGPKALDKWKTQPIGGEIRPEVWGKIFDDSIDIPQAQPFEACAETLHLTWTMDTGMFREEASPERYANALRQTQRLGYVLYIDRVQFPKLVPANDTTKQTIHVHVINEGLAPMYHRWAVQLGCADESGTILRTWDTDGTFAGVLPSVVGQDFSWEFSAGKLPAGTHTLLLRVRNPLENGKPVQFANRDWATLVPGWLSLGTFEVR